MRLTMMGRVLTVLLLLASSPASAAGEPDPSVDLFVKKCASCHSIGKGAKVGPDLKGAHERHDAGWLERFIGAPSTMLDADATARALLAEYKGVRMPDLGLTDPQVDALVALIARCSKEPCDLAPAFRAVTTSTLDDIARGERLFLGTEPLSGGAPGCMACHTVAGVGGLVGGGQLAKDLTNVFARLGDESLGAALANPAFPTMDKVFADRPLTAEEAFSLRAFLYDANRGTGRRDDSINVLLVAVLGTGAVLLGLNAAWARRMRGVRVSITAKGRSAS